MERAFTARTEVEAILLEQALAMARELEAVADAAPMARCSPRPSGPPSAPAAS